MHIARSHDPFWGLDGRSARRERILRRILLGLVAVLAVALLAMMILRLEAIDARALVDGSHRAVLVGALLADVAACLLIVAGRLREPTPA
jgi:hypothetical protein